MYLWPVDGTVTRAYAMTALAYDETMADWRTHDGIDIAADYGAVVSAMASGTVTQVYHDDRYGMTVVTERARRPALHVCESGGDPHGKRRRFGLGRGYDRLGRRFRWLRIGAGEPPASVGFGLRAERFASGLFAAKKLKK